MGAENQPMDGNPSMRGPSESATHIVRADCPHLSDPEWEVLQRLETVIGEAAVATILLTLSPTEQHGVALGFIVKEQRNAAAATTTMASSGTTPRVQSLKLHVSNYVGKEGEPLLRWLVVVDCLRCRFYLWSPVPLDPRPGPALDGLKNECDSFAPPMFF
ncbi:hypothetical protein PC128_g23274 [Phytophthora cactorum]|nr:hypothetical protein PC128_g23274 [Phytophthora cactorum]